MIFLTSKKEKKLKFLHNFLKALVVAQHLQFHQTAPRVMREVAQTLKVYKQNQPIFSSVLSNIFNTKFSGIFVHYLQ